MPKVSVVLPVYNVEEYLPKCLDSIVLQTLRDIEVICVDDGSTDRSGAIIDEYAAKDSRFRAIHQANAGAGAARNVGMGAAAGEYLFFCDPDDWCGPEMLSGLVSRADEVKADVVLSGYVKVDGATGRVIGEHMPASKWPGDDAFDGLKMRKWVFNLARHTVWDKLFNRSFVAREGIRFQEIPRYNDMLFCDLSLATAGRITVLRQTGYFHRLARSGGLQSTKRRTPLLVLDVYDRLRSELESRAIFGRYAESFLRALARSGRDIIRQLASRDDARRLYGGLWRRAWPLLWKMSPLVFLLAAKALVRARLELGARKWKEQGE